MLYNENDPFAAQWLENLIVAGQLPQGRVDRRSIVEILPDQCSSRSHFFAGIGGWPLALKLAGWPERAPVWTGSCPCQPFSQAGRGKGFADERHLWPTWFKLIEDWHPPVILGEQTASPAGRAWLDLVFADLESAGYTVEAVDLCAGGIGAPHLRQRLYFVAIATGQRRERFRVLLRKWRSQQALLEAGRGCEASRVANAAEARRGFSGCASQAQLPIALAVEPGRQGSTCELGNTSSEGSQIGSRTEKRSGTVRHEGVATAASSTSVELGDACSTRGRWNAGAVPRTQAPSPEERFAARRVPDELVSPGATAGFWADAEWWLCQDGKARAAERGSFPLVDGSAGRVGKLRTYGNAICVPLAVKFVQAVMEEL